MIYDLSVTTDVGGVLVWQIISSQKKCWICIFIGMLAV